MLSGCQDLSPICNSFSKLCSVPKCCDEGDGSGSGSRERRGGKSGHKRKKKCKKHKHGHSHSREDDDEDEDDDYVAVCSWVRQQQHPDLRGVADKCDEDNM